MPTVCLIGISVESAAIDIFRLFNVPFPILDDSSSLNIFVVMA